MIRAQLKGRDIKSSRVLNAFEQVDRAWFVPDDRKAEAYDDRPLPIGAGQTISQPYIVAYMAQALNLRGSESLLEIGTGCGYNAAILSRLVRKVYSVEYFEELSMLARENLKKAGIDNVQIRQGDGYQGWPEMAPFDAIMLTAAPPEVPKKLLEQLAIGGRLLAPVGRGFQKLVLVTRTSNADFSEKKLIPVQFVPMLK